MLFCFTYIPSLSGSLLLSLLLKTHFVLSFVCLRPDLPPPQLVFTVNSSLIPTSLILYFSSSLGTSFHIGLCVFLLSWKSKMFINCLLFNYREIQYESYTSLFIFSRNSKSTSVSTIFRVHAECVSLIFFVVVYSLFLSALWAFKIFKSLQTTRKSKRGDSSECKGFVSKHTRQYGSKF